MKMYVKLEIDSSQIRKAQLTGERSDDRRELVLFGGDHLYAWVRTSDVARLIFESWSRHERPTRTVRGARAA